MDGWMGSDGSPSGCSREGMSTSAQPGQLELGAPASPTSGHEEETAPRGVTLRLGRGRRQLDPAGAGRGCGQGWLCALTTGRYRPVGSFMNYEPISIVFASKHRVTFIKNTRKTHLGKLADFLLLTDLHKKQICPTTGNVVNEAGEGSKAPSTASTTSLPAPAHQDQLPAHEQSCPPGHPLCPHKTPRARVQVCALGEAAGRRCWFLMDAVIWDRRGTAQIWEFAGSCPPLVRSLGVRIINFVQYNSTVIPPGQG